MLDTCGNIVLAGPPGLGKTMIAVGLGLEAINSGYTAWVQDVLGEAVCRNGVYGEGVIRNEVDKVQVFGAVILISCTDGSHEKRSFRNG